MADFKTPNLAGTNAQFNSVLSTFDSIKSEVVSGLEAEAADLVATLTVSVVGDLVSKLGDLVPEIPELPNVNLQSEMSSLVNIDQSTLAGQLEFENKKAALEFQFGDGLTAGGYDLDTLTTNATAAKAAALTATTDITSATTALSDARGEVTSSLDSAFDASLKLDRSNVPNPTALINDVSASTDSAVAALSSQASSFQSLTDARGAGTRIQDVVPNFELPAAGGVAFEKASAVLQPTVDTVKEEVSTVELNKKLEEANVELEKTLEEFERDTPKVLPSSNAGAYAVTKKAKKITITHIPDEGTVSSSAGEPKEFQEDGATVTSTQTTAENSVTTVTTSGGGETILRSNVTPHGFSRRPTHKKERVTKSATKDSPSTIKTEIRGWVDAVSQGSVEIDIITLSDKPAKLIGVKGRKSGSKGFKKIAAAGSLSNSRLDRYSIDKNGRILIGWADSNGNAPLEDGTFANGIWTRRTKYDASGAKKDKITGKRDGAIYKIDYQYNDNYDPTFDGNEERVKDKGSPKQEDKNKIDLILLNKLIDDENKDYGASGVVEGISVSKAGIVNVDGGRLNQREGVYKHINGNQYTVVTQAGASYNITVDDLFNEMISDAQDQPDYDELTDF